MGFNFLVYNNPFYEELNKRHYQILPNKICCTLDIWFVFGGLMKYMYFL